MKRHKPMEAKDDIRGTPWELYNQINARYHFDLDACATHENTKCPLYFTEQGMFSQPIRSGIWTPEPQNAQLQAHEHGLTGSWKGRRVWCNPPYSDILSWLLKAWESEANLAYLLIPSTRTEQPFWQDWVEPYRDGRDVAGEAPMLLTTEFIGPKLYEGPTRWRFVDENNAPIVGKDGKPQQPMFGLVGLRLERRS